MKPQKYNERLQQLCWDCDHKKASEGTLLSRAINFGGFDFIEEVIKKYGKENFLYVLKNKRGLNKQAVNYWCMKYGIDIYETMTFKTPTIWSPF